MPIKRAAVRHIRKDRRRVARNKAVRSELKTIKKQFTALLSQQKREEATRLIPLLMSRFDRAATKGMIHRNTASRTKARLMRQLTRPVPTQKTSLSARPSAGTAQAGPVPLPPT